MFQASAATKTDSPRRQFTFWQRLRLWLFSWAGYVLIRALGPTLRYSICAEDGAPRDGYREPAVFAFWHRSLIPACFHWRNREITVLTSLSFDGEYIARILHKFGYTPVRGSSTRGAVSGLLQLQKVLESGRAVAFTADGPKGPLYEAKPGPVLLARMTALPIICFYVALDNPWVLTKAWDRFMIPRPFSQALLYLCAPIDVPADATDIAPYHRKMQAALDRAREYADRNVSPAAAAERSVSV